MHEDRDAPADPEREALLERRLRARAAATGETPRIPHQPGRVTAPLSAAQKRVWLLHEFDPTSPVWNRPLAVRVAGALDRGAMMRALSEIVQRHGILRTRFCVEEGEPRQVVLPPGDLPVEFHDLRGLPGSDREVEAQRVAAAESRRTYDLATDPMVRVRLLQLDEQEHVLLVLMHHIVFDGWSETVFLDELRRLYLAFLDGLDSPLPDPPIQYVDFAEWENQRLASGVVDRQVQYWRDQLAGAPDALTLPTGGALLESGRYGGGSRVLVLPLPLVEKLKQFSRQERASLFMTLLMTFQLLLARHADQDDIVVGVPVAGRNRSETEKLIGCFMNVLVFRANLARDPTVRELLAQVRQTALGAFANQEVAFDRLVEELRPERRPERWPLFQVMFQLRNLPHAGTSESGDLRFETFEFDRGVIGGLDLSLEVQESAGGLRCSLAYRLGRFEDATIGRMLEHFGHLLEAVARDPDQCVWTLPMLSEAERHQLLVEWNDTAADFPRDSCIHEIVEKQAEKTPDAVAVESQSGTLTYRELNRRANQGASRLRQLGVQPEALVGILVERSLEMVVGLLAILKAGGAYVPLDPKHPEGRLASVLADAHVEVLLATRRSPGGLASRVRHVVWLDEDAEGANLECDRNQHSGVGPDHLAYVLHTSGSTGTPKGVMISHASVCNYLFWRKSYFPLGEADRLLQRAPYTFDDSVWEIFEPLTVGARVVLAPTDSESDTASLIDVIMQHQITACCLVPPQLDVFLQDPRVKACTSLRRVSTGGEVLPLHVHDRFLSLLHAGLYNAYGPTEATVACTCHACERQNGVKTVPIGRPIANTQVYVLGRHLQPVPVGVRGELCVAGAGLARGYLNDPALTAERFVPNPFSSSPGARLYRTGDMARYRADGALEFLGRVDRQVKIRGHRIELGEVEAAIAGHPDVHVAAVVAREASSGRKDLVAYVVGTAPGVLSIQRLRTFLGSRLPDYMQPARWVFLDRMPVSSSGKIDRAELPEPGQERPEEVGTYWEPRSPIEAGLARVWASVLDLDRVGIRDNFFDLGGHSLLAVALFARIREEFGLTLPLSAIFQAPTVAQFARLVTAKRLGGRRSALIPIQSEGSRRPLFGIHPANGRVLMYGSLARHLGADQPVYALQSVGLDGEEPPLERVEDMASRYLAEVRTVQRHGPYHLAGFCLGATIAFEIARQLHAEGEELGLLAVVSHDAEWQQASSLAGGVRRHLGRLRRLEFSQWSAYFSRRLRYRSVRLRGAAAEMLCSIYARSRRPLPRTLRERHVAELNHRAGLSYTRRPLPLRIDYFEGRDDFHQGGAAFWGTIATGGVQTHTVPGRGAALFREPHVRALASEFAACMSRQSKA